MTYLQIYILPSGDLSITVKIKTLINDNANHKYIVVLYMEWNINWHETLSLCVIYNTGP